MKKITSLLLVLTMLISIIYLPGVTISAKAGDVLQLPYGTMTVGVNQSTYESSSGWIAITSAADFALRADGGKFYPDTAGKKYYLADNITIGKSGNTASSKADLEKTQFKTLDIDVSFTFDGCGYTIKTDNSLFEQLEAGTIIKNLVIASRTTDDYIKTTLVSNVGAASGWYSNAGSGYSCGALAWRSYGATVINVVNNAEIDYCLSRDEHTSNPTKEDYTTNLDYVRMARVGGIIGSVLGSTPTVFDNCWNKANVTAGQSRAGVSSRVYGVGGILGYVHNGSSTALLLNCRNTGVITNRYTTNSYAAGLVGSKHDVGTLLIVNGENEYKKTDGTVLTGSVSRPNATSGSQGTYFSQNDMNKYEGNITGVKRLETKEQFAAISDNDKYYLANNITVSQNKYVFSGKIYGFCRTLKSTESPFENMLNFTHRDLTMTLTGDWTRIETAEEFKKLIDNTKASDTVNKYYLGANITLPDDWSDPENFQSYNSAEAIKLEGCGYTITTSKPIFSELPGGGDVANGIHSLIRNLKIKGNVSVTAADLDKYGNGSSVGALVGKASGGIFEHIINNANVTLDGENLTARVGGIVGSAFNDAIYMMDCTNNGNVTASVMGNVCAVGGVLAYAGYDEVEYTLVNCVNNGKIQNKSEKADSYAGGVLGTKNITGTIVYLIDCVNNGKVYANSAYGNYCADRLYQNIHIIKTTPISTAEEFANISGNKPYSLKNDITISASNTNSFSGLLVCYNYTVTSSNGKLFENDEDPWVLTLN